MARKPKNPKRILPVKRLKILNKWYGVEFWRKQLMSDNPDGFCTSPFIKNKRIVIKDGMPEDRELETLIHEMLHAAFDHLDEVYVHDFAHDLMIALKRFGYNAGDERDKAKNRTC